jgi:hypothetical protein
MLGYRHGFHAGNFADVFKHALLVRLIWALRTKTNRFGSSTLTPVLAATIWQRRPHKKTANSSTASAGYGAKAG